MERAGRSRSATCRDSRPRAAQGRRRRRRAAPSALPKQSELPGASCGGNGSRPFETQHFVVGLCWGFFLFCFVSEMKTTKLSFWVSPKRQVGSKMKRSVLIWGCLTPGFLLPINFGGFQCKEKKHFELKSQKVSFRKR